MLYQRCLNEFFIHTKIRLDNIFLKQMGQNCQGQVCCKNHQNDNELPQMQVVTPLKMRRLQSKQSLFVVDEEMRATIYQGLIGQNMDENDEDEKQKQPESPMLKLGKIQSQMQPRSMFTPIKRRKLRRVQTLADERITENMYNHFFNEKINSPAKQQEETDNHSDFWEFAHIYQKIMREYEVHNLDSACKAIIHLEKLQQSIKTQRNMTQEQFEKKLKEIQEQLSEESNLPFAQLNRELLAYIKALLADMNYYYDLAKKDPYQEKYNKKGIKISTRRDGKNSAVLIQTETKDPFENIAAFFNDVRYFPDFIPFCENSYLVKDCGRNSKVAYSVFNFPVISKRESFFQGSAFNRLDYTNQIVFYGRTIHDKPHIQSQLGVEIVPNKKYVQMEFKFFVITYQPLSKGVGKLKFAANFDYGISFIPSFVEQYAIKDFGKQMFDNMMNISENFKGSKWQQSIQKDPGVFLLIREMIEDYLNKKQTEI